MEKIFHSTFEFFSHALPGAFVIASLFILDPSKNTVIDFVALTKNLGIEGSILLFALGYIVGFAIQPIGRWLYIAVKSIGGKRAEINEKSGRWAKCIKAFNERNKIQNDIPELFISDKYALVREYSAINFRYIELWNMYCAMSHNLAVASFIATGLSLVKLGCLEPENYWFWLAFSIVSFLFFGLFIHRAIKFSLWAAHDINATIKVLRLEERGEG